MQRKAGIVIGVCMALALIGGAGAAAWNYSTGDGRPVGTWHEAPGPQRSPVADTSEADGRQEVGTLLRVGTSLGPAHQKETFHYPGASYVKVHFDRMVLQPGEYLTVTGPDGTESYRYDKTTSDRWAMSINGDTAVVETHGGQAVIDRVARGNSAYEQAKLPEAELTDPQRTGREESVCGGDQSTNAVCYKSLDPVAYTRSQAIARLLINGTELCTGWRLGPKDRMLTNNHCFSTTEDAYNTEVWFNYQCAKCEGKEALKPTKVWGEQVLATDHTYDYTLFTISNFPTIRRYGYLSLDTVRPVNGQELYVPQHPAGEPTRIAGALGEKAGNCDVASNAYNGYAKNSDIAYYCDTEGGSSGSPVLSRKTNKVVGLHHFGGCPNSGVRSDILAAKLRSLL
jgi:lysyl endopeptidase